MMYAVQQHAIVSDIRARSPVAYENASVLWSSNHCSHVDVLCVGPCTSVCMFMYLCPGVWTVRKLEPNSSRIRIVPSGQFSNVQLIGLFRAMLG